MRATSLLAATSGLAVLVAATSPAAAQAVTGSTTTVANPARTADAGTNQAVNTAADPAAAPAPTQADDAAQDIVVTGFRRSLQIANEIKRDAPNIVDAISASDIGKFPDQNLAESLQRVTGVQINRNRGEGASVSIRGLSPAFARTQLNGRAVGSAGGRSFNFVTLSAEFVSAVEVAKSPTADMLEGGLAGTINVRTARPLDIGKTQFTGTVEGVYEENPKKVEPRVVGLVNYVNKDGTFGINLGAAYEKRPLRQYTYQAYGAETSRESAKTPNVDYNRDGDFNDTYSFDHGPSYQVWDGDRRRISAIGSVQFKPAPGFELYADGFFSDFKDLTVRREVNSARFTSIGPVAAGRPVGVVNSVIDTNVITGKGLSSGGSPSQGFLTTLDADGVDRRLDYRDELNRTRLYTGAIGFKAGDGPITATGEATYTRSTASNFNPGFTVISRASMRITHPDGLGELPLVETVRGYDGNTGSNFFLLSQDTLSSQNLDRNIDGRLDFTWKPEVDGFFRDVKVGLYYANRHNTGGNVFSQATAAQIAGVSGGQLTLVPNVQGSASGISMVNLVNAAGFASGIKGFPAVFPVIDVAKLFAAAPRDRIFAVAPVVVDPASAYDITEKTMAGYVRVDFRTAGDRLAGDIGARYVVTDVASIGNLPDLTRIVTDAGRVFTTVPTLPGAAIKSSYQYLLPNLNLRFNATDDLVIRGAVARVLGRPELGALAATTGISVNTLSISSGNPRLKPYLSDQADLSVEYYLPHQGLLSAAVFYKKLRNFIINGQVNETYTVTVTGQGQTPFTFTRSQPLNLAKTEVKGAEFAAQLPAAYLSSALDGIGVFGNFTYIDPPQVPQFQGGATVPLDGISKYNYTVGAYFEKHGVGLRGAYIYRSRYQGGEPSYFGDGSFQEAYGQLDASASYQMTPSIGIKADVSNLTNAADRNVNGFGLLRHYYLIGRRVTAGVNFRF